MNNDVEYMRRALALAEKGRGRTSPNPMVGALLVRDGRIIGEGWHERAGDPHAEVNAVNAAGGDVAGATLYVTLEPCSHVGRTPPCVDFLLDRQLARVVVAMHDPNPKVCGEGIFRLRAAGVDVEVGVLEDEARCLNEYFIKYITTKMPFVIAKCGMSLDGKIATRTGDSRWVTGEESRRMVHRLRNEVDAILVGSRTVMLDDPSLTTRLERGKVKDPVRVILDADSYLDADRRVFHLEDNVPTLVVVPDDRRFEGPAEVVRAPSRKGGVDLRHLMRELAAREITSVLIEGGGTTHASAFEEGIVDKVMFFIAPKIIGGRDAVTAVEGEGIERMAEALPLERMTARPVGEDILVEAYVKRA
ncbi:MAG TPA: bifunctional diaminohydroxyphosphoribosylaminopyrimidine deaminase/5-amino-6-(5-phosphoribosylamino)uracil reductase RibD [Candidatus Hydrogenedentes bacterium]|nr:bifunctional diaminohydroxyphosphoribosylaminopyrimidine deaminase/5-amino-6-(5-phosphoribosylamino)uracil reductase RibD [Candidatus Hydrogenedentota bacterium]